MFTEDNEGRFMRGWWGYGATPGPFHTDYWMEAVRPYYGNNHSLRCCPEAVIPGTEIGLGPYGGNGTFVGWGAFPGECGQASNWWAPVTACDYGSYGMNAWLCDPPRDAPIFQSHNVAKNNWRIANVAGAGNIPLLTDSQWVDQWPDATDQVPEYDGEPWGDAYWNGMLRICMNRHNGSVNNVFLDGSARKVGLKELWTLKWHREYDTCGPWTTCGGVEPNDWPEWMRGFEDH
jgi:prepilin-type processing-associated H-X9-DG protein